MPVRLPKTRKGCNHKAKKSESFMRKKILVVTAIYGRHDLARIVLNHYNQLRSKFDLQLLAIGSEGDKSRQLCEAWGWNYIEFPNNPLSQKFNRLFQEAEQYDFDFMVLVGSDDLISEEIFSYYEKTVTKTTKHLLGLKDLYFYSIQRDEALHFQGYPSPPSPKTIGAGRCFSRYILGAVKFRPWADEKLPRGLDSCCSKYLKQAGISEIAIPMEQTGGIAVDIKHPMVTLTRFEYLHGKHPYIDRKILDDKFSCMKDIITLKWPEFFDGSKVYKVRITDEQRPDFGQVREILGKNVLDFLINERAEIVWDN